MATKPTVPQFFQNDFGYLVTFTLGMNLSTATNFMVRIVKPVVAGVRDVVEHPLTQSAILDQVKGIVGYTFVEGDLDLVGSYLIQLSDITPGRRFTTKEQRFTVKPTVERFKVV